MLSLGPLGKFGGSLVYQGDQKFEYNGIRSVTISFEKTDGIVGSMTITEPDLIVKAPRV